MELKDCKQARTGKNIKRKMSEDKRFTRVEVQYINLDYTKGKGFYVKLYNNDTDYIRIALNFVENVELDCYIAVINKAINGKDYYVHKATPEEKYITALLDEQYKKSNNYEFDLCYIWDGYLCSAIDGGETSIDFSAIAKINYDYETQVLELEEMEGYKVIVDFKNNTMEGFEKEDEFQERENSDYICVDTLNDKQRKYVMKDKDFCENAYVSEDKKIFVSKDFCDKLGVKIFY